VVRPHLVATVLDVAGQPLAGVEVVTQLGTEAVTSAAGSFELAAWRRMHLAGQ
jgi:hypothetical protein